MGLKRLAQRVLAVLVASLFVAFAGQPASAQSGAPDGGPAGAAPASPQADAGRITINVVVADKLGHPVRGLEAADFTVLDNKQPQQLLGFRAVDAETPKADPVHVVIVVDMINVDVTTVARERQQLNMFLKQDGGKLANPTSIAVFADSGAKIQNTSTQDGNVLLAAFEKTSSELRTIGRGTGFWGATEQLQTSLNELGQLAGYEATRPGRKLILVISPGWPLLPRAGEESDLKQRTWAFNLVVRFTNGLRESNVALYCLDPYELGRSNPFYYQTYLKGVAEAKNATYPNLALQVLAEHSGGQVLISGRDVTDELNTAVRDASASYELTFAAAEGDRVNEYHALDVRVDKPNVKVRTTAGYYAHVAPLTR